jgi:hypothetical protein
MGQVYDGVATVGLLAAVIGAFLGGFIGLVMLIIGIYILVQKPDPPKPCTGKDCPLEPSTSGNMILGWALIVFGILIAGFAIGNYYMAKYSKVYAAASGVGEGVGMIDGMVSGPAEVPGDIE